MADEEQPQDMKQYYLLGFIVLVAVVVAGYMLRPKTNKTMTSPTGQQTAVTPSPELGPITGLACEDQYYNPVIGFPSYYLSVEGSDVAAAKKVDCTMTVTVGDKEVASEKMSSPLTEKPQRGGSTFRCTSKALDLDPNVPTKVDVVIKDNVKNAATCSATFVFPAP